MGSSATVALLGYFGPVVEKAQPGQNDHGEQGHLHERIPLGPEQSRPDENYHNQEATHRRSAFFAAHSSSQSACFLSLVAVVLAELQSFKPGNRLRSQPPAKDEGSDSCPTAPKSDVTEQAQKGQPIFPASVSG